MEKYKLKLNKKDIQIFLITFLILALLTGIMTYSTSKKRIEEVLGMLEESTLNIVEGYSGILINSKEATDIISNLLDEKIIVASEAVLLIDDNDSNIFLVELAEKFQVDQINLYNPNGEITVSNIEEYVGWQAHEGHPVYDFMSSKDKTFVEDTREDTENGLIYKFGYVKRDDNTFVQIGVLSENFQGFTEGFEIKKLIDKIASKDNIEDAFFIDKDFKITASSVPEYLGILIKDKKMQEHLYQDEISSTREKDNGDDVLHVCAPVFYGNDRLGTLSIIWVANIMSNDIKKIILSGIIQFIIITLIIAIILYYVYRKNKLNVKAAYYDKLTGLPNDEYLQEYLETVIKDSNKSKKAVILVNGTNFKIINMSYSFRYGDYILKQIANNVKSLLRPKNKLFRFNGDRFVIVMTDYNNSKDLEIIGEEIVDVFNNVAYPGSKHEYFKAQISIVEIEDKDILPEKVLRNGTQALTYLSQNTRDQIIFYNKDIELKTQRDNKIEQALMNILEGKDEESFYLEFQPKLNIKTNKIIGFEALARMNIEGLGNISPIEFISIAEERMLIYDLGIIILQKSCDFTKKLKELGYKDLNIAINISGIQLLRDEFVDDIKRNIRRSGVDINSLEFEITESVLIDEFDLINRKLETIRDFGIPISIDDFGTGFSSFARLNELKIDKLKIDKYFIDRILTEDENRLILTDIISMAHKIGLKVIVEGVEEEEQREYLEKHNCDIIQGYLISRPLAEDMAIKFLETYK